MRVDEYSDIVDSALREDLTDRGDITSESVIPAALESQARATARGEGVIAGLDVARFVFFRVDPTVRFDALIPDGVRVDTGMALAEVVGRSRSILAAERTALNLLGRMSGVATSTAALVQAVAGTHARITDTRKTMPGLRVLDKYAVAVGGGVNHRMGLYDQVMIKDNHIAAAGGITAAVEAARRVNGRTIRIIVEVETLRQLEEVLQTSADRVLLDNMSTAILSEAVATVAGRLETEASGGITLETVRAVAETGVDFISVGWVTHSSPQLDIALDFV